MPFCPNIAYYLQTQPQSVLTSQAAQCQTAVIIDCMTRHQTLHTPHTLFFSTSTAAHRHNDTFNYERQDFFHWNCSTLLILSFSASLSSMQLLSTSHCPYLARVIASICQHTIPCVFHLCSRDTERKGQGEREWAKKMSLCVTRGTGVQNNVLVVTHLSSGVVGFMSFVKQWNVNITTSLPLLVLSKSRHSNITFFICSRIKFVYMQLH